MWWSVKFNLKTLTAPCFLRSSPKTSEDAFTLSCKWQLEPIFHGSTTRSVMGKNQFRWKFSTPWLAGCSCNRETAAGTPPDPKLCHVDRLSNGWGMAGRTVDGTESAIYLKYEQKVPTSRPGSKDSLRCLDKQTTLALMVELRTSSMAMGRGWARADPTLSDGGTVL